VRTRTQRLAGAVALVVITWTLSPAAQQPPVPGPLLRDPAMNLACAPMVALLPPEPSMRILGSQETRRALFGTGDALVVAGGTDTGLRVGQEYFVRRIVHDQFALRLSGFVPISIKTAGWIRIVDVQKDLAIATVTYACDGIHEGDYLEPFVRPVEPAPLPAGAPDYENSGVLIMGDERRQIGAAGELMIFGRGSSQGVRPGQRLTIFRNTLGAGAPVARIGEATAVIVRPDTSVVRIERSRDAVYVGDRAALHR
jgi:hypothetical protein